jgi:hypothetical protein
MLRSETEVAAVAFLVPPMSSVHVCSMIPWSCCLLVPLAARPRDHTIHSKVLCTYTVDSRLSARGLTALRLNRGNVFLKKKFYFP